VAGELSSHGFGTLLFDPLTEEEAEDRRNVFDIPLLGERVVQAVDCASREGSVRKLPIGPFGASTRAAAALVAAADDPALVEAVVSRGGCPDHAGEALARVKAPTLLIVGGLDYEVIELNRGALGLLRCEARPRHRAGSHSSFRRAQDIGGSCRSRNGLVHAPCPEKRRFRLSVGARPDLTFTVSGFAVMAQLLPMSANAPSFIHGTETS
jgi:hypothetical protein